MSRVPTILLEVAHTIVSDVADMAPTNLHEHSVCGVKSFLLSKACTTLVTVVSDKSCINLLSLLAAVGNVVCEASLSESAPKTKWPYHGAVNAVARLENHAIKHRPMDSVSSLTTCGQA